jgi:hypothetical protein
MNIKGKVLFVLFFGVANLYASDSANSRSSLKYQIALPFSGLAYSVMYTSAIEGVYFLNKNENLGIRYLGYESPRVYKGNYTGKVIEIFYKKFTGNSFYVRPVLFSRDMNID